MVHFGVPSDKHFYDCMIHSQRADFDFKIHVFYLDLFLSSVLLSSTPKNWIIDLKDLFQNHVVSNWCCSVLTNLCQILKNNSVRLCTYIRRMPPFIWLKGMYFKPFLRTNAINTILVFLGPQTEYSFGEGRCQFTAWIHLLLWYAGAVLNFFMV